MISLCMLSLITRTTPSVVTEAGPVLFQVGAPCLSAQEGTSALQEA